MSRKPIDIITNVLFFACCVFLCWFAYQVMYNTARIFLCDQFIAPSSSMMPTLVPGDRIIVDKTVFGARIYSDFNFAPDGGELKSWRTRGRRSIRQNDVVVFNFPQHRGKINFVINHVYAKRCVAIPGDTMQIENGVYKNSNYSGPIGDIRSQKLFSLTPDSLLDQSILPTFPYDSHLPWTIKDMGPLYIPRKGDIVKMTPKEGALYKKIIEWETGKEIEIDWENNVVRFVGDDILPYYIFRHSFYFMGGDNVADSNDSRYWGLVPEEYIIGVATWISYSMDKKTGIKRKERRWKKISE